jgi:hypothetical protein
VVAAEVEEVVDLIVAERKRCAGLRAITDQPVTDADQHQGRLLLCRFHRHEAHRRPAYHLAKPFSVRRVVLAALTCDLTN